MEYSVLMSVYHKEKPEWLKISIESMLAQTVKPNDFVIVKDGPLTHELETVLNGFCAQYPELFNIVALPQNIGLGPALAEGIKHCKNEWIARMDSDDYSSKNRCEKQIAVIKENPQLCAVGCYEAEFENDISSVIAVHKVPEESNEIAKFMRKRCALLHPTVMYKKSAVLKAGNYRDVRLYEDYDLFARMVIECGQPAYNIPESLYFIRINDGFFARRGGIKYLKTAVSFKFRQWRKGYITFIDFIISGGGQAVVCLMPNRMRKAFYLKFLR